MLSLALQAAPARRQPELLLKVLQFLDVYGDLSRGLAGLQQPLLSPGAAHVPHERDSGDQLATPAKKKLGQGA